MAVTIPAKNGFQVEIIPDGDSVTLVVVDPWNGERWQVQVNRRDLKAAVETS